jgi:DNA-binding NarL/FixJ family response regulator
MHRMEPMKSIGLDSKTRSVLVFADEPGAFQAKVEGDTDFKLIGSSSSRDEIISLAREHHPDLILFCWKTDADLSLVRDLRNAVPKSGLVVWVNELGPSATRQAVALGVRAILSTTAAPETFKQCLLVSARGGVPASTISALHRRRKPAKALARTQTS